jgi:Leucine-rich repeat (LRR) protein
MEKLQKLQLDNNIITKIEGLGNLTNLTWLDLSFNMITVIEGLDKCTKLTDLTLFQNRITKLGGLEQLTELQVLSVGSNQLASLEDSIDYLRKLKNNLQVLRISNNAFQKQRNTEYKKYTIARLKNLKYIDYELIDVKEKQAALDQYKDDITQVEASEQNERADDAHANVDAELRDAKIECTVDIFNRIMLNLEEDQEKLKQFQKFQDVFSMH